MYLKWISWTYTGKEWGHHARPQDDARAGAGPCTGSCRVKSLYSHVYLHTQCNQHKNNGRFYTNVWIFLLSSNQLVELFPWQRVYKEIVLTVSMVTIQVTGLSFRLVQYPSNWSLPLCSHLPTPIINWELSSQHVTLLFKKAESLTITFIRKEGKPQFVAFADSPM